MQSPTILVVDDEPALLLLLTRAIRKIVPHARVDTVTTSHEAAHALQQCDYSLLITDYNLDGTTGTQLAAQAKQRSPATTVLLLSGELISDSLTLPCSGVDAFLSKPFEINDLARTIRHLATRSVASQA